MAIGIGERLADARTEQGRTIEDAARDTRVRPDYLRALEDESFGVFGGDVYAKGFLSTYARYLGLDPAPLLEDYRRNVQHDDYNPGAAAIHPVAQPSSASIPTWVLWSAAAALVLVASVAAANVLGQRNPSPATPVAPQPVATDEPSATASPSPSPTASPSPTFEGVNLTLLVEGTTWMRVEVDDTVVESGQTFEPGDSVEFGGPNVQRIFVHFGNAGGVRVQLNGRDLGAPGASGQVVKVIYTPEGPQPAA